MNSRKGQFRWRRPFSAGTKGEMGGRDPARTAKLSLKAGITAFEIAFFIEWLQNSSRYWKIPFRPLAGGYSSRHRRFRLFCMTWKRDAPFFRLFPKSLLQIFPVLIGPLRGKRAPHRQPARPPQE
ncbi:MAG: hypothetical protein BAA03_15610 [Caldibacillus debilis]|nr:MAG: hypothetical protein BAA03_15610 [Caldibacillus debilis]